MGTKYKKELTFTEDVAVNDWLRIGGTMIEIDNIRTNVNDQLVFDFTVVGERTKKRQKGMLIIHKKLPVTILK